MQCCWNQGAASERRDPSILAENLLLEKNLNSATYLHHSLVFSNLIHGPAMFWLFNWGNKSVAKPKNNNSTSIFLKYLIFNYLCIPWFRVEQIDSSNSGSSWEFERFKDAVNQSSNEVFTKSSITEPISQKPSFHQKRRSKTIQGM